MKHNTELEEGEARCCNNDEDNIDLHSFSYIDERIQHVLGHFQKDFEGGVSAEHLGAKFGGYGSFLPTYERFPFQSCAKTPQRHYSSPKSPSNLQMEAAFHSSKAPSNAPPGTASHAVHSFHNLRAPSVDDSVKKDTGISSNAVMEKCTSKTECAHKSGNSTDQRTLKLRIKVKSDILAKKNASIYSGLGLDNSPSSSMGNSPEESEGMPPVSQETPEESPTGIVQVMTSFPIPGGVLISPLNDSLLYLIRTEKVLGDSRPMSSLNGHQEHCSMSTDESDSFFLEGNLSKKRKVRMVGQSEKQLELKHINGNHSENDMTLNMKKRLGNRTPERKDFFSNDMKRTPLSSSICDAGETAEVTGKAFEISKEVNKDGVKCRLVSIEAVNEDSLESITGQDFDKVEKQNTGNSFNKEVLEHKPEISHNDNSAYSKNNGKCNAFITSKKAEGDAEKCKVDPDAQKREINQKGKEKSEGKNKSNGEWSPFVAKKDSVRASNNAVVSDKKSASFGVTSCEGKMHKIKSVKNNKVRDCDGDLLKGKKMERKVDGIDLADGPLGHNAIMNDNLDNVEGQSAYMVKVKDRPSGNNVANQLLAGPGIKDASGIFPGAENKSAPEMLSAVAPQLIAEDWVCCDRCQKWRLLPMGLKPEQLPEKWLCSMLNWLPGMNRCNISEEETTKAVYALYQVPTSEGQNNMQNHTIGPATGVRSADALQFGLNHKMSSSDVVYDRGKKKHGVKEKTTTGINNDMHPLSNTAKNNAQDYRKNRGLSDMNQQPVDLNLMKKSSSKHMSRLNSLIEENMPKEKEKQKKGGDKNHIKLKCKLEADQYKSRAPKKSKTEDVYYADKQLNPGMDFEKVDLNTRNGLPTKATGKDMRKYDEYCLSEDAQDKLLVPVKKGDQAQFLSDNGSLDVTNSSKKDGSIRQRKLKDWMDNEKHDTLSVQGDMLFDEEGNASGFRKENNYIVLNSEGKSVTEGYAKLNREGGVRPVFLSDSRDQRPVGTEVKNVDKAQQPRKHRKNVESHQSLGYFDPLGKDLGSGQLSLATTSSSSKISGSHKARTNPEDVRGSPVESVTSSPLRTSNLDKRILAAGDTSGKNDARKGDLSSVSSIKSLDNRDGRLLVKVEEERIPCDLHPASNKLSSIEYQVEDFNDKARVQAKTSSEVKNDHLLDGHVDTVEQHVNSANGSWHEEKMKKNNQESAFSWQKSGKATSLRIKEKDRRSGSEVSRDKKKVSALENGFSKNGVSYDSAVDPSYQASGTEAINDAKNISPKSKHKIGKPSKKNSVRHRSSETGTRTELKQKDFENSVLKVDAPCNSNRKIISQQNLIQDFEEENKANLVCTGSREGKSKFLSSSEGGAKWGTSYMGSRTAPGSQKGDMSNGHPVHASGNEDVTKLVRNSADASCKVGVNHNSENFAPDGQLTVSSPMATNSSQTAFSILEEATKQKDRADHFKNSGFEFESNETYFEAALMFLHGASLLESCHSESGKHGEMSQTQTYATTAKLFGSCAHEYERRQEMATAALAYKCLEVVYMRVVCCKHSCINRDRHELQSTLQLVSQGESPSSSASDVDNLNSLVAVDKGTLPRSANTLVANNQVISARNRPNLARLFEFIQDTNFAMEASRKCQRTFNMIMEEAQYRDCITSIRKVVDFSFEDVDELVQLVRTAMKAVTSAGVGRARD